MRITTMTLPNNAGPEYWVNAIGVSCALKRIPEMRSYANGNSPDSRLTSG